MKNLGQINDPKDLVTKQYVDASITNGSVAMAANSDKLDGYDSSEFTLTSDLNEMTNEELLALWNQYITN